MSGSANIELFIYGEANKVLILNNTICLVFVLEISELTCLVFWARWILKCPYLKEHTFDWAPLGEKE